jgi:hypothetical protein
MSKKEQGIYCLAAAAGASGIKALQIESVVGGSSGNFSLGSVQLGLGTSMGLGY